MSHKVFPDVAVRRDAAPAVMREALGSAPRLPLTSAAELPHHSVVKTRARREYRVYSVSPPLVSPRRAASAGSQAFARPRGSPAFARRQWLLPPVPPQLSPLRPNHATRSRRYSSCASSRDGACSSPCGTSFSRRVEGFVRRSCPSTTSRRQCNERTAPQPARMPRSPAAPSIAPRVPGRPGRAPGALSRLRPRRWGYEAISSRREM